MDTALMDDVLQLVRSVDMEKLMSDVKASDQNGENIDSMIATMTKTMLQSLQQQQRPVAVQHTIAVSLADAHSGKRRKIRIRHEEATRTHEVPVPRGCTDKELIQIESEHGPVTIEVSVPSTDGAFTRVGNNLYIHLDVSIQDTRRLNADIQLPWGEIVRISENERAHPIAGWHVVRGAGMHVHSTLPNTLSIPRGDLFVNLVVRLPATWDGIDISGVANMHSHAGGAGVAARPIDVPTVDELTALQSFAPQTKM
jgi:DnaJ-class molecular chaperone